MAEEQIREKIAVEQKQQKPKLIEVLPEKTAHKNITDVEKHEIADK